MMGPLCPHGSLQPWSPKSIRGLQRSHPYSAAQRGTAQGGGLRVSVVRTVSHTEYSRICHDVSPVCPGQRTSLDRKLKFPTIQARSGLNGVQESSHESRTIESHARYIVCRIVVFNCAACTSADLCALFILCVVEQSCSLIPLALGILLERFVPNHIAPVVVLR